MYKELIIIDKFYSWRLTIGNLFKDVLRDYSNIFENHRNYGVNEIIDSIKKECPEIEIGTDASWLDDHMCNSCGGTPFVSESLANKILDRRMYLLAYHACRPIYIKSYYENGLVPLNEEYIREYFNLEDYPSIPEDKLAYAIKYIKDDGTRLGKIYFVTNPEIICNRDSHYLKRGSECLSIIASKCNVKLKAAARPAFFICSVPVQSIPKIMLKELSALLLNIMFKHILDPEGDWCKFYDFYIEKQLHKDNIFGHFYPVIN